KPSQHFRDRVQVVLDRFPALDEGGKPNGVRIAPHDDHRFGQTALGIAEVGDAQITAGGESTIENDLVCAGTFAPVRCAEIQEIGDDRLFDFVGLVADQNDDARVGFAY